MDKDQLVEDIKKLKTKLNNDVRVYYAAGNTSLGQERLNSWFRSAKKILSPISIELFNELKSKPYNPVAWNMGDTDLDFFNKYTKKPLFGFLDSLMLDLENNEFELPEIKSEEAKINTKPKLLKKAFIVHGHDSAKKFETARFLEKIGFEAIILHEQANGGKTIIEKLEEFTDVGFGIVLYTPDDVGEAVANQACLRPRARQNVIFEHGLLIGKLGRDKVYPLVTNHNIELPGDITGMVYMSDNSWEIQLAKEIRTLGYDIDFNKLI
ncbi:TPA: TIR domain-containing protein [Acinetobacter baumannii]|uniref:TIR domain-containing protein n=1 Tax=Acinetobacter TaxID=469 RepID=UPI0009921FEB|nr:MULTISPECIES: nucleotide-binding protein [Acinetobacter]MDC5348440.1 nucleotide-binding protein [Acinetobacter baumannii]MDO7478514.1 nucleotide-binding protein [Acinetobacter baumannii]MDV7621335.1 nucleotide-binding protein [Acinetobacter baumannii]MDY7373318.1 nucleotide-binding protein [Acinetobacter oleivorans]OOU95225.1 hypothetical protein BTG83_02205 [Acinetobacter baumannii]